MSATQSGAAVTKRVDFWTVLLCWTTVMLEGYDLVVLPAVNLILQKPDQLGWTQGDYVLASTLSYVGVMIGAILVGPLADRLGRRKLLIGSVILFSLFTIIVPFASSVLLFSILRLIAGFGLGACMPTALTLMSESLPANMKARASTLTMTGYHAGAVIASLLAIWWGVHWEWLFYAAGVIGLVVAVIQYFKLPESEAFLASQEAADKAPLSDVLKGKFGRVVITMWVASFMGLMLVYGLNTWLPRIMAEAGYAVTSSAVVQLLVLNLGGIAGLILGGLIADKMGINKILNLWFLAGAILLALLSIKMSSTVLLSVAVFLTGVFIFPAQVLVYAYATKFFPVHLRSTAMGSASGVGRIATILSPFAIGALFPPGQGYPGAFYFFAVVAVLGLLAVVTLPKVNDED